MDRRSFLKRGIAVAPVLGLAAMVNTKAEDSEGAPVVWHRKGGRTVATVREFVDRENHCGVAVQCGPQDDLPMARASAITSLTRYAQTHNRHIMRVWEVPSPYEDAVAWVAELMD